MKYKVNDVVRFKTKENLDGFYEVISNESEYNTVYVSNDECNTEFVTSTDVLILVCKAEDRKDM